MRLTRQQSMTRAFQFARVRNEGPSVAGRLIVLSAAPAGRSGGTFQIRHHLHEKNRLRRRSQQAQTPGAGNTPGTRRAFSTGRAHGVRAQMAGGGSQLFRPGTGLAESRPQIKTATAFRTTRHGMMKWLLITLVRGLPILHQCPSSRAGGPRLRLPLHSHLFPILHPGRPGPRSLARFYSWNMAHFKMQPLGRFRV